MQDHPRGDLVLPIADPGDGVQRVRLEEDLNLREVVYSRTEAKGPNTYFRGKDAIDGIWVSEEAI